MKKILIIQNEIMHYRKPVYNELAKYYDITVLHSGKPSLESMDKYKEIITKVSKVGSFYFQSGVMTEARSEKYNVVIAMFDVRWIANILAMQFNKKSRFLYWGHRYGNNNIINHIRNFLMKKSDGVILYSDTEVDTILKSGINKNKLFVAENTIEVPNHEDGTNKEKSSLLFVGRAQKRKKVDKLLKAFAKIKDKLPQNTTVDIIGSGEENDYLQSLAKELKIDNQVVFHGAITDNEKLKSFFHKAFAYVSPGPVGLGVLHSLAYGVPVITYKNEYHGPEFDNLKNKINSIIVNDFEELKQALILIVNEKEYMRLGKNAYELYSQKRTIQYMIKGFIEAIEENND
jgi:glycosyltransferase involved in cell wall biosynthesis